MIYFFYVRIEKTMETIAEVEGSASQNNSFEEMKNKIFQDVLQLELKETILDENPLKSAIEKNKLAAVKYYIENDVDIHFNNDYPMLWAVKNSYFELVKLLHQKGCHVDRDDLMIAAIQNDNLRMVEFFHKNGFNCTYHDTLLYAIKVKANHIVKYLVKTIDTLDIHENNEEALREAVYVPNLEITSFLLQQGAVAQVNNNECLDHAINGNNVLMVKELLKYGATFPKSLDYYLTFLVKTTKFAEKTSLLYGEKYIIPRIDAMVDILLAEAENRKQSLDIVLDMEMFTDAHVKYLRSKGITVKTINERCSVM